MGQVISGPHGAKDSGSGRAPGLGLAWGFSSTQGWRDHMEDAHFAVAGSGSLTGAAAFGVLDGHGGDSVARLCSERLPEELAERGPIKDDCAALIAAFERMDKLLVNGDVEGLAPHEAQLCGCAATVCLVRPYTLAVANAGDCRVVLCRGGRALPLTQDHKPSLASERARIHRAGGFVEVQQVGTVTIHRVNGGLSCSRAIGDLAYKADGRRRPCEQLVCATPEVRMLAREADDEFMILACDGVWDVMSSQDVVAFVRKQLGEGAEPAGIMDDLLDMCLSPDLAETGGLGGDNMTAILVVFGRPEAAAAVNAPCKELGKGQDKAAAAVNAPCKELGKGQDKVCEEAEIGINQSEVFATNE